LVWIEAAGGKWSRGAAAYRWRPWRKEPSAACLVYRLGTKKINEVNGGGKEAAHSSSVEASSSKVEQGKGSLLGMEAMVSCSSLALKQR
jgi:hypothetical protein